MREREDCSSIPGRIGRGCKNKDGLFVGNGVGSGRYIVEMVVDDRWRLIACFHRGVLFDKGSGRRR